MEDNELGLSLYYHNVNQKMHTIYQNHNNVMIYKLIHVLGLTGPSSLSAQLHKAILLSSPLSSRTVVISSMCDL